MNDGDGSTLETLDLESFLPYRLNRIADVVSRRFAAVYRERHGLTRPEWRALATIGQFGTVTASRIVEHSAMHKTKVSRAVAALHKRGWLERVTDSSDRRVEHLRLTVRGRKAYRGLVPVAKSYEAELLAMLTPADGKALLAGLDALEGSTRS